MELPLISILIPVRNGEKFLEECLNSILNQTYSNWELIIVNDNSEDSTQQILDFFSQKDERIKNLKSRGTGIIAALQLAYSNCKGSFITRMDADDVMTIDKIKLLSANLLKNGKGFVAVGLVQYFAKNGVGKGYFNYQEWLNNLTKTESNFNDIYRECVIPSPCWMVHREDFEKCGGFNSELYPEDYDLCFRFYKQGIKVSAVNQAIHHWRDYSTRTSRIDPHYSDNFFLPLKMKYFLELHHDSSRSLEVWGAGNKGKALAKYLIEHAISFDWACNNTNKIGKEIYGKILISDREIFTRENPQILIAVGVEKGKQEIKKVLDSKNLALNKDYFFMS